MTIPKILEEIQNEMQSHTIFIKFKVVLQWIDETLHFIYLTEYKKEY